MTILKKIIICIFLQDYLVVPNAENRICW